MDSDYQSKIWIFFLVVLSFFSSQAYSQDPKPTWVGIAVLGELLDYSNISPSIGFVLERRYTSRSGVEIGTFYRTSRNDFFMDINYGNGVRFYEEFQVRQNYLTFPILYRYYAKVVTLSVGPFIEAFVGWDQVSANEAEITDYKVNPSVKYGPLLKVNKSFSIGENLSLEPELRFGVTANPYMTFYGVGVQLKELVHSRD